MWRGGCTRSNVWIADISRKDAKLFLNTLFRVQCLPGKEPPFNRLISFVRTHDFTAAAIDAPFSVPLDYLPQSSRSRLCEHVWQLPREARPFAKGCDFAATVLRAASAIAPELKPLRKTERFWQARGVNVRSTLWAGARPGAPMTVACLTFLCRAEQPIWPWTSFPTTGVLAEAFPAAQLRQWNYPHAGYNGNGPGARENRDKIIAFLSTSKGLVLGTHEETLKESADALDAVLCTFAAMAVTSGNWVKPGWTPDDEGLIAVHA
jgi:uncharacterized protein DUF429